MSAQTSALIGLLDLKVELKGSLDVPVLVNNSDRNILGYVLKVEDDSGMPSIIPVYRMEGILPGAKDTYVRVDDLNEARAAGRQAMAREVHRDGTPVIVSRISLDSVIFADGEFAGPDAAQFHRFAVARINAVKEFASQALGDMARIETAVHTSRSASPQERIYRKGKTGEQMIAAVAENELAEWLFDIQQKSGLEAARQAPYRLSQIPKLRKAQNK